ncbi:hypothetical protein PZH42_31560, partial [Bacteroides cellulosilyticus]
KPYQLRGDSWHFMGIPQMTRRYAWAWFTAIKGMNANAVRPHHQFRYFHCPHQSVRFLFHHLHSSLR